MDRSTEPDHHNAWRIPKPVYRRMAARAEADYPEETCGCVFGSDETLEVVPMRNVQNDLHRDDPERFPRDARTAYYLDPAELLSLLREKGAAGIPLRAIYHSHPDRGAYFSETDSAVASPFGEPSYPGVVYLVLSVRAGRAVDLKGFDWSPQLGGYVETPVVVGS